MNKGKKIAPNVEDRRKQVMSQSEIEAKQKKIDRDLGTKFEALKILTQYFASGGKTVSGAELAAEVEDFLTGIHYE